MNEGRKQPEDHKEEVELRGFILSDSERGWALFVAKYETYLRSLIGNYRFSPEDAQEVFQELCIRLVKSDCKLIRDWVPEKCSLRGYLSVITTSVCLNFLKSSFHRYNQKKVENATSDPSPTEVLSLFEDSAPSPRERLMKLETLRRLEESLVEWAETEGLSKSDRVLLYLRLGGMNYHDISEILDISEQNAAVRFHRMKVKLRDHLSRLNLVPNRMLG